MSKGFHKEILGGSGLTVGECGSWNLEKQVTPTHTVVMAIFIVNLG